MRPLKIAYALSGAISLGYQLVWLKHFVERFGSSTFTFALVVGSFIGALGAGALASGPFMALLSRRLGGLKGLVLYGAVELAITLAASVLLLEPLVPLDLAGSFPYRLEQGIYEPTLLLHLRRIPLALACIVPACFLMGTTFPYLCRVFSARPRFPASLYAWNTLGACLSVLLCEFWLFLKLGTDGTMLVLLAANAALGAVFLLRGRALLERALRAPPEPALPGGGPQGASAPLGPAKLLLAASISGFLAGALEADALRRIHFAQIYNGAAMAFVSFWAVAAIFVASWIVHHVPRLSLRHVQVTFLAGFLGYLLLIHGVLMELHPRVNALAQSAVGRWSFDPDGTLQVLGALLLSVGVIVFPPYLCISTLLPLICNVSQARRRHLGLLYGLNTVAFLIGLVLFSWLAPSVNMFYAYRLWTWTFAALCLLVLVLDRKGRVFVPTAAAALASIGVAALVSPTGFDRSLFPNTHVLAHWPVRAVKGSAGFTSLVATSPAGDAVFLDTGQMSSTAPLARRYMKEMIHLPLLAQRDPRQALLICFGVGNSASAIAKHESIVRIDAVDLARNILETAPEFEVHNEGFWEDPRVRMIHDDGRNFLATTDERYDLVTSEPPPPLMDGIWRLYTADYYEDVLAHLTPTGCMSQWLPVYQMPPAAARLVVRTFVRSFPYSMLLAGNDREFLLVGSASRIDFSTLVERYDDHPRILADLTDIWMPTADHMLGTVGLSGARLAELVGDGPIITDRRNLLSVYWPNGRVLEFPFDAQEVRNILGEELVARRPRLTRALEDLHELNRLVTSYAPESLAHLGPGDVRRGHDVPWRELRAINVAAEDAFLAGDFQRGLAGVQRSLALLPEQLSLLLGAGWELVRQGRPNEAETWFRNCIDRFGEYPIAHYSLAAAQLSARRTEEALAAIETAVELNPLNLDAQFLRGQILEAAGRPRQAFAAYAEAVRINPRAPQPRQATARLSAALQKRAPPPSRDLPR